MTTDYVADTMALVLRLERRKLPIQAKEIFSKAEKKRAGILIPAIVLAEIGYLSEKKRIEADLHMVDQYCKEYDLIKVAPLTGTIIQKSFEIDDIPELHDRLIAGTGYSKGLAIISNDPKIMASKHVESVC